MAELNRQLVEVDSAEAAVGGHLQVGQLLWVEVPPGFGYVGVEGDGIGSGNHGLFESDIFEIAAGGAVAEQDAVAVQQGDAWAA